MEATAANQKQMFYGIEYEGPLRGNQTLFVQGDIEIATIEDAVRLLNDRGRHVQHIYFGAGRLSQVNMETVRAACYSELAQYVTVETPHNIIHMLTAFPQLYHMLSTNMLDFHGNQVAGQAAATLAMYSDLFNCSTTPDRVIVKLDTGLSVLCCPLSAFRLNWYQDYKGDELVFDGKEIVL